MGRCAAGGAGDAGCDAGNDDASDDGGGDDGADGGADGGVERGSVARLVFAARTGGTGRAATSGGDRSCVTRARNA